jgi:hypothetical protein
MNYNNPSEYSCELDYVLHTLLIIGHTIICVYPKDILTKFNGQSFVIKRGDLR